MTVTKDGFISMFNELARIDLPKFTGTRVMMMPIKIGDLNSVPPELAHYLPTLHQLFHMNKAHWGKIGYLTIDEKEVKPDETHRRAGLHVDGVHKGSAGGWGGGGGGGWGSAGNGMITVASHVGCRAWNQEINGWPGYEGECEHLAPQLGEATVFKAGMAYWVDGLCIHESMPMTEPTLRQFVRLSNPSDAPWFEGYTPNPLGIKPTGEILPRRPFM